MPLALLAAWPGNHLHPPDLASQALTPDTKDKEVMTPHASADHTINPDVERFGYQRAGTAAIEIDSSHLVMLSHLNEIADLIRTGITATAD